MFVINALEIKHIKGDIKIMSESFEVEYHNDLLNATQTINYFNTLFGKHYKFYIVEKKNNHLPFNG